MINGPATLSTLSPHGSTSVIPPIGPLMGRKALLLFPTSEPLSKEFGVSPAIVVTAEVTICSLVPAPS